MINLDYVNRKLVVKFNKTHPNFQQAYLILRSLLSARSTGSYSNLWNISYDDLQTFKKKLDGRGLVEDRYMTKAAHDYITSVMSLDKRNKDIKDGLHNQHITSLLEGKLKTTPYEDQITGISYLTNNYRAGLFDSMGIGKAQPLTSKILTPKGWVLMGDIKVGDKVVNSQGKESKVIGVYPQGVKPVYKVTFSDGSSTECCDDHLWQVQNPSSKYLNCKPKVKSLKDIKNDIFYVNNNRKHYIPIIKPVEFEAQDLPIHPYILGCILGDGCISQTTVSLSLGDFEIADFISSLLPDSLSIKRKNNKKYDFIIVKKTCDLENPIIRSLKDLNLMGCTSSEKFIPNMYKFSSLDDRFSLLQGLLDTDGHCHKNGCIEYTSVSKKLITDIQFLVQSFGGKATLSSKIPHFTHKGAYKEGQRAYRLHISFSNYGNPFKLPRKAERWRPRTKYPPTRGFDKVEYVGEKEVQCISVDSSDSLYVTDDFILTHNTMQSLGAVAALQNEVRKVLVICPKSVISGFSREVSKHTYLKSAVIPPGKKTSLDFLQKNLDGDWNLLLVHPENLIQSGGKKSEIYGPVTKLLKTIPFDMIIVDEWHQYKNLDAKRTKCVLSILNEVRTRQGKLARCILMTGTPISESPVNAYATLKVLTNRAMPHIKRFENYFTVKKDVTYGSKGTFSKIVGYKNLAELKSRIERVSIRRTKDDLTGFPDKIFVTRDVELSGRQKDLYKTVCGELVASLPKSSKINLAEFFSGNANTVRLRQLMNHPLFLNEDCDSAKYDEIDNILEELFADPEQKVVVWSEYRKAIDLIYDRWNKRYGVVKIYGGVELDEDLAKRFEEDDKPRIAACIPAKAGTGVDFLARARTSIYIDRPYSLNLYQQSLDRIHRRVKTVGDLSSLDRIRSQPATLIFLDIPNSLDELVKDRLMVKQNVSDAIMTSDSKLVDLGRADLLKYLR